MSLIYDESDLAEKEEEINMDKILSEKKEKKSSTAKKKRKPKKDDDEDALAKEALMNIPTKSLSLKRIKNKNFSPVNLKDVYDTSLEGVEIPLLNNNINNGSLMLTELLDLDNNNSDIHINKSKSKSNINIIEQKDKEKEDKNSTFLKKN